VVGLPTTGFAWLLAAFPTVSERIRLCRGAQLGNGARLGGATERLPESAVGPGYRRRAVIATSRGTAADANLCDKLRK
jgi:hypothetical protein